MHTFSSSLHRPFPPYSLPPPSLPPPLPDAIRRAHAFGLAFSAHLQRLSQEPGAYGKLGLADLFELREETLREFDFRDAYRLEKERETRVALQVLPDLLAELDRSDAEKRLQDIVQGCLAANIFDWGARSCVQLYEDGQILDIYRQARETQSRRPWRVDTFDSLAEYVLQGKVAGGAGPRPLVRVVTFVDNSGADAVLGMLPFARELLRMGTEVRIIICFLHCTALRSGCCDCLICRSSLLFSLYFLFRSRRVS